MTRVYTASGSSLRAYALAISVQAALFMLSAKLEGESEVLFALIYVFSAVFIAIFAGRGAGMLAGLMASISVDFHYNHPAGRIFDSLRGFAFFMLSMTAVQLTLFAVKLLQDRAHETEKAVRAREEILSILAHDLRQPLTSLSLRNQLARLSLQRGKAGSAASVLDEQRHTLDQMDRLIQDILDTSKIDANGLVLNRESANLKELLEAVATILLPQFQTKRVDLRLDLPQGKIPQISLDAPKISRVISNLLSNAIKFTPEEGKVSLSVELLRNGVEISVKDSGPGVPQEKVEGLFDRRWQAERTAHLGAGLGLYICHGIVAAHGGTILYEAQSPHGAEFKVFLPFSARDQAELDSRRESLPFRAESYS